jgi:hypothetical protein
LFVRVSAQPSAQNVSPSLHSQRPATHARPGEHFVPQAPQFSRSLDTSMQRSLQWAKSAGQAQLASWQLVASIPTSPHDAAIAAKSAITAARCFLGPLTT